MVLKRVHELPFLRSFQRTTRDSINHTMTGLGIHSADEHLRHRTGNQTSSFVSVKGGAYAQHF